MNKAPDFALSVSFININTRMLNGFRGNNLTIDKRETSIKMFDSHRKQVKLHELKT